MNENEEKGESIPSILHSFYEDRPFRVCTRCGESLADFEEGYRVSKNFKKGEVILEYALCLPCLQRMLEESSEESKGRLARFQQERLRENVSGFEDCAFCETTRADARGEEYGIAGVCCGDRLLDSALICIDCIEEMHELLSEETRDVWKRFREENFPGVPADFEPFPGETIKTA